MRLVAFKYGITEITESMAFINGDDNVSIPIGLLFFLIEDNDRKILVDVGCDTMPGFKLYEFEEPVKVLESYGIKRTDITDVIITHAHHDHIDAVYNYSEAIIHIHQKEYEPAKAYLKRSKRVSVFDDDKKITDNIEIKHVGGHSEGSCVVRLYADKKTYVLCGDECYTKENFTKNIPTGCTISLEKSKNFVEEVRNEKYIPIIFHDLDVLDEIGFRILYEN